MILSVSWHRCLEKDRWFFEKDKAISIPIKFEKNYLFLLETVKHKKITKTEVQNNET